MKLSPNATGSLYMALGSLGYVLNDAFVRRITEDGPGVYQVLFYRSICLAAVFLAVGRLRGEQTRRVHLRRPLLLRVAAETVASAFFFAAVLRLEFANAQAILQVVPFLVTLAAVLVLGEQVNRWQYAAIGMGFVGVLVIIRPATDGFSAWSLMAVGTALLMVIREFATRRVDSDTPAVSIALVTAVGMAIMTGALSLTSSWEPMTTRGVAFLAAAVISLFVGYVFTIETVRIGDLSVSAPFRYATLLGAVVVGYVLFDEVPDVLTILGSGLIVVAGLMAMQLERRARHEPTPSGVGGN